ncbi:MAG: Diguanylate cyclase domain-containing protein [Clostridia bacterium 41_269]|nr:MAG: Diguanylate cyclase domain-containing protein [Clostridia bacterium 41_269]
MGLNASDILLLFELFNETALKEIDDLISEAVEKLGRILEIKKTAVLLKERGVYRSLGQWGFKSTVDLKEFAEKPSVGRFVYSFSGKTEGLIFFETGKRITEREKMILKMAARRIEEIVALRQRELELIKNIFDAVPVGMFLIRNGRFWVVNSHFEKISGYDLEELYEKEALEIVFPKDRPLLKYIVERMLKGLSPHPCEFRIVTKEGRIKWVEGQAVHLVHRGNKMVLGSLMDLAHREKYVQKLERIKSRDPLTGLYNRASFESQLDYLGKKGKYPISIIVADFNGLKEINDSMGFQEGDRLLTAFAGLLKKILPSSAFLARVGDDEFAALLPQVDEGTGLEMVSRLRMAVEKYNDHSNSIPMKIAFGLSTAQNKGELLGDSFKKAEEPMTKEKICCGLSFKSKTVDALLTALSEHDCYAEQHSRRMQHLCFFLGDRVGLSPKQKVDLALLAQVHDVGKVGISDRIILKEGPLTTEEWEIMRLHPEKGCRIAMAAPELADIAHLILKHHERWDGKGYPLKLKKEEIPLECRILSIVDAFDAMTSDRPYRKSMSPERALEEIRRCAGSQFDPEMAEIFVKNISEDDLDPYLNDS